MRTRLGIFLSLWSFGFACVHVAWASGWRGGLDSQFAPISERPWFLAYDLLAGFLMYGAAVVAWMLAHGGLPKRLTRRLTLLTMVGSGLALGRGVPALVWDAAAGETGFVSLGADIWFTLAGLTGVALAVVVRREVPQAFARDQQRSSASRGAPAN
ncbi:MULTISPECIES: hypothetical protein [unclassified Nocardioides]|uniref:hypothetical protein n=1 Tax=unclassified Nocardioides TaxID=2615069 RepID=UPI0006FAB475|nr:MULTISPECIES: hypothetical protein [unclassified Nocardioides]KQY57358.1 hypothetical protein ASD30_14175 [Nocardioides sp. Root140]KQZ68871.1 hypothetical protein ASD66_16595 [Nocardioides sp. Root151]KRF20452.1 hypothetical protein ASH02_22390 [Nocardioides sp. Soil796]